MANLKKLVKRAKKAIADCEDATKAARDFLSAQGSSGDCVSSSCSSSSKSGEDTDTAHSKEGGFDSSDMEGSTPFST